MRIRARTEQLTKVYGNGEGVVVALDHVKLSVDAGECVAVMGPSGCGKSTLLHLMGRLDRPTEGQVMIDGSWLSMLWDEFVTRWVPVEFTTAAASQELASEKAAAVSESHPRGFRLMAKALADADTSYLLQAIRVPTLFLWGDDDRRSPPSVAELIHNAIPESELAIIAHAGHVGNMKQPGEFNTQVRQFVETVSRLTITASLSRELP